MVVRAALAANLLLLTAAYAQAQSELKIGPRSTAVFATVAQAKELLTHRDEFVERMSLFDRAARLKLARKVSEKEYLAFVGQNVLAWSDAEKKKVTSAIQAVQKKLLTLGLPLPARVLIIKTTGKEEGGAAYTRGNAIVLPQSQLAGPAPLLQKLFCHELFHVLSRSNADMREKCYAAIGFEKCDELRFPKSLVARKITNPDAPKNDHCIRIKLAGKQQWAIPILYSRSENYDAERGGEFFDYLEFRLLLVSRKGEAVKPIYDGKQPKLVGMQDVTGFFEQVGRNTSYIIHPEESLADNFALLVMRRDGLPSPGVIEKLRGVLKKPAR